MRHFKIMGLCLVAVFALVAVAASSASASEPEWGHCLAQKHGNYTEGNCATVATKKGVPDHKGHFEWLGGGEAQCYAMKHGNYTESGCATVATKKGVPDHKGHFEKTGGGKFEGNGGAGVLNADGYLCRSEEYAQPHALPREQCNEGGFEYGVVGVKVECSSEHATGEATGSNEVVDISVRFKGCTTVGEPATTHGLLAGEIQVNPLKGRLGYINKASHEVGVLLEPVSAGGLFAEFEVLNGEALERVGEGNATEGSFYEETASTGDNGIISPITPVNQMTHTFTQNYRSESISNYPCKAKTCIEGPESRADLNVPSRFEGGQLEELEWQQQKVGERWLSSWSPASEEITNVNTVEGEAEIKG